MTYWLTPGQLQITEHGTSVSTFASLVSRCYEDGLRKQYYFWKNRPVDPLLLVAHGCHSRNFNMHIERGANRATSMRISERYGWYPIWLASDSPCLWPVPGLKLDQTRSVEIFKPMVDIINIPGDHPDRWQFMDKLAKELGCTRGTEFISQMLVTESQLPPRTGRLKAGGHWVTLHGHDDSRDIAVDSDQTGDLVGAMRDLFRLCSEPLS